VGLPEKSEKTSDQRVIMVAQNKYMRLTCQRGVNGSIHGACTKRVVGRLALHDARLAKLERAESAA
jgi:hypothetical protein